MNVLFTGLQKMWPSALFHDKEKPKAWKEKCLFCCTLESLFNMDE